MRVKYSPSRCAMLVAMFSAALGTAVAQAPASSVNARDLFWSGANMADVRPNPAKQPAGQPVAEDNRDNKRAAAGSDNSRTASMEGKERLTADRVTALGYGEAPHLQSSPAAVLGLRYAVLERATDATYSEVLPSSIFHAGDRIRLSIMPNQPGYLYIVQRGTSGTWSALFPGTNAAKGSNHLGGGQVYEFPSQESSSFQFDGQAGTERLFLVFARMQAEKLEEIISLLREHSAGAAGATRDIAGGCASDAATGETASRDLLMFTAGTQGPQTDVEKAVYVVNQVSATGSDPMVVACLAIAHE